jgi:hypothetical protein
LSLSFLGLPSFSFSCVKRIFARAALGTLK